MSNKNPKTDHLPKQATKWQNLPTSALRVPEKFLGEIRDYAIALDSGKQVLSEIDLNSVIKVLPNWNLQDLIKLQLELPLIIEGKKNASKNYFLENCILYLAGNCDGAYAQDGIGFNGADTGFGHWLAERINGKKPIIKAHAQAALKMVTKYNKQLERGNLTLPSWELIKDQYPENLPTTQAINDIGEKYVPDYRVEVKGNEIAVYTPYDKTGKSQRNCKTIDGWKFIGEDKSWRFPLEKAIEVNEKLVTDDFCISAQFKGAIALCEMRLAEEKAAREAEALDKASEIVRLVEAANLDAPLTNGWYLRDYQKQGAEWLLAHRRGGIYDGGILADHMGLGKTLTALAAAKAMQCTQQCHVFVVAPVSLLDNWVREAEKIGVSIECFSWAKIPKPLETQNYVLICDESHYAQNINSQRTKKMLELGHHSNCLATWLLTGTPIKNGRPINLYPLLFAVNHPLASDKWEYERHYCNAHHKSVGKKSIWDNTGAAHLDELSKKTEDIILRRTKQECLPELPAKTRLFKQTELEPAAVKDYQSKLRSLIDGYKARAKAGEVSEDAEALVTLNYLRKIGSEFKVDTAVEIAEELLDQGQQVVIFTEFLESAEELHHKLGGVFLTGSTHRDERQLLVDKFQSGAQKVFIGTIKAGGVGITLTAASNVILLDRAWTPGDCEQAEDRCHRLGQSNSVFATWIQLGEIDNAIDTLLQSKQDRIELILKGKRKTLRGLDSPKELAKQLLEIL
ncbi:DEAD/DEAH box helicase [Anabaena cylindrica UHCC 0172]|uniref:DEAD/DEAH box helicase n=1 Tax=Anabaena cylindrica TaxID=1165 RepID=UPI002B1EB8C0|nr:DEAD/DEAH box helicase [Anabaena cylindrica]MEA5553308.1 DEAD/DEAH box helicase [Anabaena cylindrica UHCC 0172]